MNALVTGSAGGIGRAIVDRLATEGYDVLELDLVTGFDVASPDAWAEIGAVQLAFLNAGVLTGERDIAALTNDQYRRAVAVNVDGVVLGTRRLAQVMKPGGAIVATASLAGLTGIADDPIYGLTKHAVVGFVRSVAPQLAGKGIRINALCPAWADTALMDATFKDNLAAQGYRLLEVADVAEAAWAAATSVGTGEAWIAQVGRPPLNYEFRGVPGPR